MMYKMDLHISKGDDVERIQILASENLESKYIRLLTRINDIIYSVSQTEYKQDILFRVRDAIVDTTNYLCSICKYDADHPKLISLASSTHGCSKALQSFMSSQNDTIVYHNFDTTFGYAIKNRCVYISNDMRHDSRAKATIPNGHCPMDRLIIFPLMQDDMVTGCLMLTNSPVDFDVNMASSFLHIIPPIQYIVNRYNQKSDVYMNTAMIQNISTCLRTPLTSIIAAMEVYRRNYSIAEIASRVVNIVDNNAQNMVSAINDIQMYSKLVNKEYKQGRSNFRISDLISNVVREIGKQHTNKEHIRLHTVNSSCHDMIYGDYSAIQYILSTLLSNAYKFTDEGDISVTVGIDNVDGTHSRRSRDSDLPISLCEYTKADLSIIVSDTGIGIPISDQSMIFEEFYRGACDTQTINHCETTTRYSTGLGLSICKKLVQLYNGTIGVHSDGCSGSKFIVTLKILVTPSESAILDRYGDILRKRSVLIMDDNVETKMRICTAYHEWGIPSYHCVNIKDMEGFLKNHKASMVLINSLTYGDYMHDIESIIATIDAKCNICVLNQGDIEIPHTYLSISHLDRTDLLLVTLSACKNRGQYSPSTSNSVISARSKEDVSILLVEYDNDSRIMSKQMLNIMGYSNVDVASSSSQAVDLILKNDYDVVFVDDRMPVMSGIEIAMKIHTFTNKPLNNFILLSGGISDYDMRRIHRVGINNVVMKPYNLDDLQKGIGNIVAM